MKVVAIFILGLILSIDPKKVSKINSLKSEAKKAFLAGDFKTAIAKYKFLRDSLGVTEEEVGMNLANSYFNTNDTTNATSTYQPLTLSGDKKIKSWSNQQLGVVANRQGKFEEALNYFKQAMKAEPQNDQARYNYEMVKKKLEEQKKQEQKNKDQNKDNKDNKDDKKNQKDKQDQQNKDKQNKDQKDNKDQQNKDKQDEKKDQKDQQNKDQKDQEKKDQEKKDKEQQQKDQQQKDQQNKDDKNKPDPSLSEKLKDMKISEEKAKMILEAMKNQEVQYLQQNKRKATKPKDKGKPDW